MEVYIDFRINEDAHYVFLYEKLPELSGGGRSFATVNERGDLVFSPEVRPLMVVPHSSRILDALLQGILSQGIKPKDQSWTEGKLEATEKHLEDSRKLSNWMSGLISTMVEQEKEKAGEGKEEQGL